MKRIFLPLVFIVVLIIYSCSNICGCEIPAPPKPLNFEVVGNDGKTVLNSLKDSVTISYTDNNYSNQTKTIHLQVKKLYTSFPDTTTVASQYNGLYITDNGRMSILSSQTPAVNNFSLYVNGVLAGAIYINYQQYQTSYPQLSSLAFTFNKSVVTYNSAAATPSSGVELLQSGQ